MMGGVEKAKTARGKTPLPNMYSIAKHCMAYCLPTIVGMSDQLCLTGLPRLFCLPASHMVDLRCLVASQIDSAATNCLITRTSVHSCMCRQFHLCVKMCIQMREKAWFQGQANEGSANLLLRFLKSELAS